MVVTEFWGDESDVDRLAQLYMPNLSPMNSLSEYTIDFALNRDEICTGIIVYHAGVAGKLGCLKLKSGLLHVEEHCHHLHHG